MVRCFFGQCRLFQWAGRAADVHKTRHEGLSRGAMEVGVEQYSPSPPKPWVPCRYNAEGHIRNRYRGWTSKNYATHYCHFYSC